MDGDGRGRGSHGAKVVRFLVNCVSFVWAVRAVECMEKVDSAWKDPILWRIDSLQYDLSKSGSSTIVVRDGRYLDIFRRFSRLRRESSLLEGLLSSG